MLVGDAGETATSMKRMLLVEFGPEYGTGAPEATASFMKVVEATFPFMFAYTRIKLPPVGSAATWTTCDAGLDGTTTGRISVFVAESTRTARLSAGLNTATVPACAPLSKATTRGVPFGVMPARLMLPLVELSAVFVQTSLLSPAEIETQSSSVPTWSIATDHGFEPTAP